MHSGSAIGCGGVIVRERAELAHASRYDTSSTRDSANPSSYVDRYGHETSPGYARRVRKERFLELLGSGRGMLLDLGCGPGIMAKEILDLGWQYHGCDASKEMIDEAQARVKGTSFSVGRAEQINFPDNTFDVVVAMGLVEYRDDEHLALKEVRRVLRPGGRLLVSICNWWSPLRMWDRYLCAPLSKIMRPLLGKHTDELFHRQYTTKEYSKLLAEEGFSGCSCVYYNLRLLPRPLDLWLPRISVRTANLLEPLRRTPLRFWGTGAVVDARRTRDSG